MEFKEFNNIEELENYLNSDEIDGIVMPEITVKSTEFGEKDFALMFEPVYRVSRGGKTYLALEGIYMSYDEDAGGTCPDWDISLIYDDVADEDFDPTKFIYFEQGSVISAINNYCNILARNI